MKRILHVQVFPKLSGVQRVSLEILKSLPQHLYEKHILFSSSLDAGDRIKCQEAFEKAGVKVHYLDSLRREIGVHDIKATWQLYKFIREYNFDIVHTNSTKPGIIGRIAAWFARVPLIIHTVHGLSFHKFISFPKWQFYWGCEMFASIFCDKICIVNKYYQRYFRWFKNKTLTVYNGIDFGEFAQHKIEPHKSDRIVWVLSVGRLDDAKDPLTLLKAAKIVVETNPAVSFTIVGDGKYFKDCQDYIHKNNLDGNITLAGWQQDVAKFYSCHDIFANSSIYEAFGLMFTEAGFFCLPSVTTNVEGIPEVIEDGVTGLLSDPKDYDTLAHNILHLVEDKKLRLEMGQNAKHRVTQNFSAQKMVAQYLELYKQNR